MFDLEELDFLYKLLEIRDIHNQQNWDKECCKEEYHKIKKLKSTIKELKDIIK